MAVRRLSREEVIERRRKLLRRMSEALLDIGPGSTKLYNALSDVMALWEEGSTVIEDAK